MGKSAETKQKANPDITLSLSDAELVDIISEKASRHASTIALARLNFFLSVILAVIGLLVGASTLWIDKRIADRLPREVEQRVEQELSSAVLLPLLVSEANSMADRQGYSNDDADYLIELLTQLLPDINGLSEEGQWLAQRRVEEIMDAFWGAGDYVRVFAVNDLFENRLLFHNGILVTMSLSMATGIVIHPDFQIEHEDTLTAILSRPMDHRENAYEYQRLVRILSESSAAGWSKVDLQRRFNDEVTREPYFARVLFSFASQIEAELDPDGGRNSTEISIARYKVLSAAVADY